MTKIGMAKKLQMSAPPPPVGRLGHLPGHFDHFLESIDASSGKIRRLYIHFPGSYGHSKNNNLVHFYTFYNFKMAITPKLS